MDQCKLTTKFLLLITRYVTSSSKNDVNLHCPNNALSFGGKKVSLFLLFVLNGLVYKDEVGSSIRQCKKFGRLFFTFLRGKKL